MKITQITQPDQIAKSNLLCLTQTTKRNKLTDFAKPPESLHTHLLAQAQALAS